MAEADFIETLSVVAAIWIFAAVAAAGRSIGYRPLSEAAIAGIFFAAFSLLILGGGLERDAAWWSSSERLLGQPLGATIGTAIAIIGLASAFALRSPTLGLLTAIALAVGLVALIPDYLRAAFGGGWYDHWRMRSPPSLLVALALLRWSWSFGDFWLPARAYILALGAFAAALTFLAAPSAFERVAENPLLN